MPPVDFSTLSQIFLALKVPFMPSSNWMFLRWYSGTGAVAGGKFELQEEIFKLGAVAGG